MSVLIESIQTFKPESQTIPSLGFYACNIPLAKLQEIGADVTVTMTAPDLRLAQREVITGVSIYVKEALDGTAVSRATVALGISEGGSKYPFQSFLDVSINTLTGGELLSSPGSNYTASTNNFVTNGTLGTLLDSVSGNCTPQAITALIATSYSRVTTVNYNGIQNRPRFTGNAADLYFEITLTGANLEDLSAGDLWIYFETKQYPNFVV